MPIKNQYIYVVDHDGINGALLKLNYVSNGYECKVKSFQSIKACVKEIRKNAPLIVLIDAQHLASKYFVSAFRRVSKIIDRSTTKVGVFSSTSELHSTIRSIIVQTENAQLDGEHKVSALDVKILNDSKLDDYTDLLYRRNIRRFVSYFLFSAVSIFGVIYCGSSDINSVFFLSLILLLLISYWMYVLLTSKELKIKAKS